VGGREHGAASAREARFLRVSGALLETKRHGGVCARLHFVSSQGRPSLVDGHVRMGIRMSCSGRCGFEIVARIRSCDVCDHFERADPRGARVLAKENPGMPTEWPSTRVHGDGVKALFDLEDRTK